MKVRIGIGATAGDPEVLASIGDGIVAAGFDSLWLPEVLTTSAVDPLVGLAWAAGRHDRLKVGATMLLPGRHPLRAAKALASLDRLSGGRLLLTVVPGLPVPPEREAVGSRAPGRAIDELLPLLRRLWSGEEVTWSGDGVTLRGVRLAPVPLQDPLEVWLGGMGRAALERCGRLGDGWLPAQCTPEQAAAGREVVEVAAAAAGRTISEEHFGVSIGYAAEVLSPSQREAFAARARGADPAEVVPVGPDALRERLERFVAVGFSKFVLRPLQPPGDWTAELERLRQAVGDLQT